MKMHESQENHPIMMMMMIMIMMMMVQPIFIVLVIFCYPMLQSFLVLVTAPNRSKNRVEKKTASSKTDQHFIYDYLINLCITILAAQNMNQ